MEEAATAGMEEAAAAGMEETAGVEAAIGMKDEIDFIDELKVKEEYWWHFWLIYKCS